MFLKKITLQLFLLFFLFGCVANKKMNKEEVNTQKMTYQQVAEKKMGKNIDYRLNADKSCVLCEKIIAEPNLNPNQLVEFLVYNIEEEKIIYMEKIANVKISWHNNTQLLITKQKGYITNPTDTGKSSYIFDLKSKKSLTSTKTK
jgi:hypothetical protein